MFNDDWVASRPEDVVVDCSVLNGERNADHVFSGDPAMIASDSEHYELYRLVQVLCPSAVRDWAASTTIEDETGIKSEFIPTPTEVKTHPVDDDSQVVSYMGETESDWSYDASSFPKTQACSTAPDVIAFDGTDLTPTTALGNNWYGWAAAPDEAVVMSALCLSASLCPQMTRCVLSEARFTDELNAVFAPAGFARSGFLSTYSDAVRHDFFMPETFIPKVLISPTRVIAMMTAEKHDFGLRLGRNIPGATKISIHPTMVGENLVMSLADPLSDGSLQELGRVFFHQDTASPMGRYWTNWATDVIRLERFDYEGRVANGPCSFDIYAPGATNLHVFALESNMQRSPKKMGGALGRVSGKSNWFRFTHDECPNADYVGVDDIYECELDNGAGKGPLCDIDSHKATCHENAGAEPTCTCKSGYVGLDDQCEYNYEAEVAGMVNSVFRLHQKTRGNYWKLNSIKLYTDTTCQTEYSLGDEWLSHVSTQTEGTAADGHTKAPVSGIFRNQPWVERDSGQAEYIEFVVEGGKYIQCVEVFAEESTEYTLVLHQPGDGDETAGSAINTWHAEAHDYNHLTVPVQIVLPCGMESNEIREGNILSAPKGAALRSDGVVFGSFEVSSACGCQRVADGNIHQGVRIWSWNQESQQCHLMGPAVRAYTADMPLITDSLAPRFLSFELSTETVVTGQEFCVTLDGVNLKDELTDGTKHIRIKILRQGQSLTEAVPHTVDGIGCAQSTDANGNAVYTICSPRPSQTTSDGATFCGLRISASEANEQYVIAACKRKCADADNWNLLQGSFPVAMSDTWWHIETSEGVATSGVMERKISSYETNTLELTVTRSAFSSPNPRTDWRVKILKQGYDCELSMDFNLWNCAVQDDGACSMNEDLLSSEHDLNHIKMVIDYDLSVSDVGLYKVCFGEVNSTHWREIPAMDAHVITVTNTHLDDIRAVGVMRHQRVSALAGHSTTIVLKGHELRGDMDHSRLVLTDTGDCTGVDLANAIPVHDIGLDSISFNLDSSVVPLSTDSTLTACFCDATTDQTLDDTFMYGSDLSTFQPLFNTVNSPSGWIVLTEDTEPVGPSDSELKNHLCQNKCTGNCVGRECFCEGYLPPDVYNMGALNYNDTLDWDGNTLCLDESACRSACRWHSACVGYQMHKSLDRCVLLDNVMTVNEPDEDYVLQLKADGTACREADDFSEEVATVHVTKRVTLNVEYVITPNEESSIEVVNANEEDLTYIPIGNTQDLGFSKDRIMVIECEGVCGSTNAAHGIVTGMDSAADWGGFAPVRRQDELLEAQCTAEDRQAGNCGGLADGLDGESIPYPVKSNNFTHTIGKYMRYHNIVLSEHTIFDSTTMKQVSLETLSCYSQCHTDDMSTSNCNGYLRHFDLPAGTYTVDGKEVEKPGSHSLCVTRDQCLQIFDHLKAQGQNVHSIDVHRHRNRCFINQASDSEVELTDDENYEHLVWVNYDDLDATYTAAHAARQPRIPFSSPTIDYRWSFASILRFNKLTFTQSGKYKFE